MTREDYNKLVSDRPDKATAEDVHYRPAEGRERCRNCMHMYERVIDRHGTCEIFRSDEVDEEGLNPNYVCDWQTKNGEYFPLQ